MVWNVDLHLDFFPEDGKQRLLSLLNECTKYRLPELLGILKQILQARVLIRLAGTGAVR